MMRDIVYASMRSVAIKTRRKTTRYIYLDLKKIKNQFEKLW